MLFQRRQKQLGALLLSPHYVIDGLNGLLLFLYIGIDGLIGLLLPPCFKIDELNTLLLSLYKMIEGLNGLLLFPGNQPRVERSKCDQPTFCRDPNEVMKGGS